MAAAIPILRERPTPRPHLANRVLPRPQANKTRHLPGRERPLVALELRQILEIPVPNPRMRRFENHNCLQVMRHKRLPQQEAAAQLQELPAVADRVVE